ncbi:MAG: hypothetical protein AB1468_03200 [Candidatus Micrarchaeota archaeon]
MLSIAMLAVFASGVVYYKIGKLRRVVWADRLSYLLPILFLISSPLIFTSLDWGREIVLSLSGFGILFVASFLTLFFLEKDERPGSAYASNLFGSGAGAVFAIFIMWITTPFVGIIICSLMSAIGGSVAYSKRFGVGLVATALLLIIVLSVAESGRENVIWQKWNSFSYITVHNLSGSVFWGHVNEWQPASYLLTIDSVAGTALVLEPERGGVIAHDITHMGYYLIKKNATVAIIGSGGGRDVIGAREFQPSQIVAIEINPAVIEATQLFTPSAYSNTELVIGDGRATIDASADKFDLIQLTLVDTFAAVSSGAFALTESYLYTTESFSIFLNKLSDDGVLSVSHWRIHENRLVGVAEAALRKEGVERTENHIIVIVDKSAEWWGVCTLLVKKSEWTPADRERINLVAKKFGFETIEPETKILGEKIPTDDSPFFFYNPAGGRLLFLLGGLSLLFSCAILIVALHKTKVKCSLETFGFFGAIGLGYMLIETVFLQKFLLFLHDPTITITVVFSSFLIFSALGSLASARTEARRFSVCVVLLLLVFLIIEPILLGSIPNSLYIRMVASIFIIAPIAFCMGVFFPTGFERVKHKEPDAIGVAWSVNGLFSVIAPILSLMVAISAGFKFVLLIAAFLYALAYFLMERSRE